MCVLDPNRKAMLLKRIEYQDDNVMLEHLQVVKVLGQGMFGNVFLCISKANGRFYALKAISRNKIQHYQLADDVNAERAILMSLDHPMILKLIKTFKDIARVYFLTEYIQGTDLFDALRKIGL